MSTREQLAEFIRDGEGTWRTPLEAADAILEALAPRTVTTVEELDALPVGSVVIHDEGWGRTAAERHASDRLWYVTGCLEFIRPEVLLPATVLYAPEVAE